MYTLKKNLKCDGLSSGAQKKIIIIIGCENVANRIMSSWRLGSSVLKAYKSWKTQSVNIL
jgi:hypothetical protein